VGDNEKKFKELAKWIVDNLGPEVPFHILRFFPSYKMMSFPDTPVQTLEKFAEEAKKIGMKYVYVGNVPGHENENTYCPNCNTLLIERAGFTSASYLKNGKCPKCGTKIDVVTD
jgi:pyruvate formate lyase activating enzyme